MDFTTLKTNLEKMGYLVTCFDTAAQACEYLEQSITGKTIGIGGSVTIQQMNLFEKLSLQNKVYWHWKLENGMTADEARAFARNADIYLSSVNGIAESGEIINIDGNGNRVSEIMYGHEKVYFIVGENKIEKDYDSALFRARNIAAPLNAKRLSKKTPCAIKADKCYNCKSPDRICRGLSVLWSKPECSEYEVILIHEHLGY